MDNRRRASNLTLDQVRDCVLELLREGGSPSEIEIRRRVGGAPTTVLALRRQVFAELLAAVEEKPTEQVSAPPNPLEVSARELWDKAQALASGAFEKEKAEAERLTAAAELKAQRADALRLEATTQLAAATDTAEQQAGVIEGLRHDLVLSNGRIHRLEQILRKASKLASRRRKRSGALIDRIERRAESLDNQLAGANNQMVRLGAELDFHKTRNQEIALDGRVLAEVNRDLTSRLQAQIEATKLQRQQAHSRLREALATVRQQGTTVATAEKLAADMKEQIAAAAESVGVALNSAGDMVREGLSVSNQVYALTAGMVVTLDSLSQRTEADDQAGTPT